MCQAILLLYYVEWVGAVQVSISLQINNSHNFNTKQEKKEEVKKSIIWTVLQRQLDKKVQLLATPCQRSYVCKLCEIKQIAMFPSKIPLKFCFNLVKLSCISPIVEKI